MFPPARPGCSGNRDEPRISRMVLDMRPCGRNDNLAAGIPLVTTSIALVRNGVVELGVVFDPNRDELFRLGAGRGMRR